MNVNNNRLMTRFPDSVGLLPSPSRTAGLRTSQVAIKRSSSSRLGNFKSPGFFGLHNHKKTLVLRIFDKDHPTLFPRILKWLLTFNKIKNVHVHSEFCADGGIFNMILLLPFLLMIKLTGRRVTFFAHNVADDLTTIAPHLNLNIHSFSFLLLNKLIPFYYQIINFITDEIVVLDESIKKRLLKYISPKSVTTLPLWSVKKDYRASKKQSRARLSLPSSRFTLIYFGFITYYKGADWLVDSVKKMLSQKKFSHLNLILAGGPAHSLSNKPHYQRFYNNILDEVSGEDRIKVTGFVDEKDIGLYMTAADLCIFPYRDMIGASGSLSHALSYKKPFIVSDKMLDGLIQNPDFENICKKIGITTRYPMFSGFNSFRRLIGKLQKNSNIYKLKKLSRLLAENQKAENSVRLAYEKLIQPYQLLPKGVKGYEFVKAV